MSSTVSTGLRRNLPPFPVDTGGGRNRYAGTACEHYPDEPGLLPGGRASRLSLLFQTLEGVRSTMSKQRQKATVVVSYLPYPVVAGFLGSIGRLLQALALSLSKRTS